MRLLIHHPVYIFHISLSFCIISNDRGDYLILNHKFHNHKPSQMMCDDKCHQQRIPNSKSNCIKNIEALFFHTRSNILAKIRTLPTHTNRKNGNNTCKLVQKMEKSIRSHARIHLYERIQLVCSTLKICLRKHKNRENIREKSTCESNFSVATNFALYFSFAQDRGKTFSVYPRKISQRRKTWNILESNNFVDERTVTHNPFIFFLSRSVLSLSSTIQNENRTRIWPLFLFCFFFFLF